MPADRTKYEAEDSAKDRQEVFAEGERLILAAFAAARDKGVRDWRRMTTAVLKNRLLELTNREFDEGLWKAQSFRQFLDQYSHLVAIDPSQRPAVVELLHDPEGSTGDGLAPEPGFRATPGQRIRPDLWRAILDYSSGRGYVWDQDESTAMPVATPDEDPRLTLPTVDAPTYASWRDEFAGHQAQRMSPLDVAALERWRSEGLPTSELPPGARGLWNAELKRHVIETLEAWFKANQVPLPSDLVRSDPHPRPPSSARSEDLRELILACVAVMTREELAALNLPPAAILRMPR